MDNYGFGCPIEVLIEALKDGIIVKKNKFDVDVEYDWDEDYVHSNIIADTEIGLYEFKGYEKYWYLALETKDDFYSYKLTDYKKTWWIPSDFKAKLVKGFWRW